MNPGEFHWYLPRPEPGQSPCVAHSLQVGKLIKQITCDGWWEVKPPAIHSRKTIIIHADQFAAAAPYVSCPIGHLPCSCSREMAATA